MYCRKCGKQLDDRANYCSSCGSEVVAQPQDAPSAQQDDEHNVAHLEAYFLRADPEDANMTGALVLAGEAYMKGKYCAPVDKQKACEYYRRAAKRGDGYALFALGWYYLMDDDSDKDLDGDNEMKIGIGVMYLTQAHMGGYQPATDMLNKMIKDKLISGVKCIDDIVKLGSFASDE